MNKVTLVEILLIFICLAVISWAVFLMFDFKEVVERDKQRIVMLKKVQNSLENFYQVNNYYPGSPYINENSLLLPADWQYLITCSEMKDYFNFAEFKDPCQPDKAVELKDANGLAVCSSREVIYQYIGVDCQPDCQGYRLAVELEDGSRQELVSKTMTKETND